MRYTKVTFRMLREISTKSVLWIGGTTNNLSSNLWYSSVSALEDFDNCTKAHWLLSAKWYEIFWTSLNWKPQAISKLPVKSDLLNITVSYGAVKYSLSLSYILEDQQDYWLHENTWTNLLTHALLGIFKLAWCHIGYTSTFVTTKKKTPFREQRNFKVSSTSDMHRILE